LFTVLLSILAIYASKKVDKADPLQKPTGVVFWTVTVVDFFNTLVKDTLGEKYETSYGPYIGSLGIYLLVSNLSGLFSFNSPTRNFSVTLTLAVITWILVQYTAIKETRVSGYLKSFIDPLPVLLIPNIFGKIAPLISLSMRLFGNILSGSIIMGLLYTFLAFVSNSLVGLVVGSGVESFNFLAVVIAPWLHGYFDVFAGCIQMYIFIVLTMVYIKNEIPEKN